MADGHGLFLHLVVDAAVFTLLFLRADTSTDSRKDRCQRQHLQGIAEAAALDVFDEGRDIVGHRTLFHAARIGTVETAARLKDGLLCRKALIDFVVATDTIGRVHLRHFHPRHCGALFGGEALAQLFTPLGIAGNQIVFFHCHTKWR